MAIKPDHMSLRPHGWSRDEPSPAAPFLVLRRCQVGLAYISTLLLSSCTILRRSSESLSFFIRKIMKISITASLGGRSERRHMKHVHLGTLIINWTQTTEQCWLEDPLSLPLALPMTVGTKSVNSLPSGSHFGQVKISPKEEADPICPMHSGSLQAFWSRWPTFHTREMMPSLASLSFDVSTIQVFPSLR